MVSVGGDCFVHVWRFSAKAIRWWYRIRIHSSGSICWAVVPVHSEAFPFFHMLLWMAITYACEWVNALLFLMHLQRINRKKLTLDCLYVLFLSCCFHQEYSLLILPLSVINHVWPLEKWQTHPLCLSIPHPISAIPSQSMYAQPMMICLRILFLYWIAVSSLPNHPRVLFYLVTATLYHRQKSNGDFYCLWHVTPLIIVTSCSHVVSCFLPSQTLCVMNLFVS